MSDLAVKLFMIDNDMHDFDSAQKVMLRYGIGQEYADKAAQIEAIAGGEDDSEAAFADGAAFIGEVVEAIKFAVPGTPDDYDPMQKALLEGVEIAADAIKQVVAKAVAAAQGKVDESPLPEALDDAQVRDLFTAIFGEQTTR